MPYAYVTLAPSLDAPSPSTRVHALLLPNAADEWPELTIAYSPLDGGFGLKPGRRPKSAINWAALTTPVLMPYLGAETVTKDAHAQRQLLEVLKGNFERLTLRQLSAASGGGKFVADGLFAVPAAPSSRAPALADSTSLLQVNSADGGACYLLAEDAKQALHLHGSRSHLFELLCAHAKGEHADRNLATHVAMIWRKEEGYVLINAHPADPSHLSDTLGFTNQWARSEGMERSERSTALM